MGFMDFVHAVGSGFKGAYKTVSKDVGSIGKAILNYGGKYIDKVGDVIQTGITTGGSIVNKGIDVGGGVINKGASIIGGVTSTVSFIPILLIGGAGLILYQIINNAESVGRGINTAAQGIAPIAA